MTIETGAQLDPPRKAVDIARQIALGLDSAHGKGIVYRGLGPDNAAKRVESNIWMAERGR